jgi:hypothetical protein
MIEADYLQSLAPSLRKRKTVADAALFQLI